MRKLLLTLGVLLALTACEQAIPADDSGEREESKGNLVVSIFQLEQTPFTRAAVSASCTRLNFAVYDSEGTRLSQVNQKTGDADFGTASFQLPEGTYQLVAVAHSSDGNPTMTDPTKIKFTNTQGYTDTFLYQTSVTVEGQTQTLSLSLSRIVSLCRVVITDNIPANVAQLRFQYKGGSGAFNAFTGLGSVNSTQTVFFPASAPRQYDLYTFLHDEEDTIHLLATAYDANDNVLCEREFDVPLLRNQITWLTGDFFTNGGANASQLMSTVTINTQWAGEQHLSF